MGDVVCSIRNILADVTNDPLEAPSLVADARARDERAQSRHPESRNIVKPKSKSYLVERVDTKSPSIMDVRWLQELTPRAPAGKDRILLASQDSSQPQRANGLSTR
ncbi:hypothetical protein AA0117_g10138 [Alternaria alternata]|jgi:hypothetical protein|uniref:Uncharacterized protein n=1 Tax=Alternaria alternata TaxID=5599 RepID=A0A4Q4N5X7_ALTAL|nr:hypothetical protein AA0117_g10138 [Alternaria alternata]